MEKAIRVAINAAVKFVVSKTPANYFHFNESGKTMNDPLPTVIPASLPSPPPPPPLVSQTPMAVYVNIKVQQANLRAEPGMNGKVITVLKLGSRLTVLGKTNDWYRVRTESGEEGYVGVSVISSQP